MLARKIDETVSVEPTALVPCPSSASDPLDPVLDMVQRFHPERLTH